MCLDVSVLETIVRQRHAEAEAYAAYQAAARSVATPWRVSIGRALIRFGERLAARAPRHPQPSLS
jgi:hypothetical protein